MAASLGALIIDIVANTASLQRDMAKARDEIKGFRGAAEAAGASITNFFSGIIKGAAAGLTLRAIAQTLTGMAEAAALAERHQLRLGAVLRATGRESEFTAAQLGKMADELEGSTLFDDKAIQSAMGRLLTFENISRTTFTKAIGYATDLAAVMETDVVSAATALGKALQDPAAAAELLRRAQVKLTDEEKAAITAFVELGQIAEAQELIFKKLSETVGGAAGAEAEGLAGDMHRLSEAMEAAQEAGGNLLIQAGLPEWLAKVTGEINTLTEAWKKSGSIFGEPFSFRIGPSPGRGEAVTGRVPTSLAEIAARGPRAAPGHGLPGEPFEMPGGLSTAEGRKAQADALRDRLALLAGGKATAEDTARLREQLAVNRDLLAHAKQYNLTLQQRADLTAEAAAIEKAFLAAEEARRKAILDWQVKNRFRQVGANLGARQDLTRMGAGLGEETLAREGAQRGGLGLAMLGVGGAPGQSPYSEFLERTDTAAKQWREAWKTAIEAGAHAMADFFQRALADGMKLTDFLKGLIGSIAAPFWALVGTRIASAIGGELGLNPVAAVAGGGANSRMARASAAPRASVGGVQVSQHINLNLNAMDGVSAAAFLRQHGGTIAGVVAQAASEAPAFARHIVANGMR